jgi:diacylglycerol kinase family enzyme
MNALLILNAKAGSLNGERDAVTEGGVVEAFATAGITVTTRHPAPHKLCETLQAAVAERPDAIFVGGGDGSISAAAGCLADTGIPLGVLPLGTLNHFAHDMGMPTDWKEAIAGLAGAPQRAVDVAEVNGHVFINNCSLGSYPEAVHKRDALRRQQGLGKWLAMTWATFVVFRRLRRLRLRIETGDGSISLRTPFVFVGNNCYSGHVLDDCLRPRLDGGKLCIYTTRAQRRLALLHLAWQSLVRSIDAADGLETREVTAATITHEGGGPLPVAADGELLDVKSPLRFRIRPRALLVLSPAAKPERASPKQAVAAR